MGFLSSRHAVCVFVLFSLTWAETNEIVAGSSENKVIDRIQNEISISYEEYDARSSTILEGEEEESLLLHLNTATFDCSIPKKKERVNTSYSKSYPPAYEEKAKKSSPLSPEDMEALSEHFKPLNSRCHLEIASTIGKDYLYQVCFSKTAKRGAIKTLSSNSNQGTSQITWKNDLIISNATEEDNGWWGVVENDPTAYHLFGYSTYLYQWYGENVIIEYHCAEKPHWLFVDERKSNFFVFAFASPIVCTNPLLTKIRNQVNQIKCQIDGSSKEIAKVDGSWNISQGASGNKYSGSIEFSEFQYFEWKDALVDRLEDSKEVHESEKLSFSSVLDPFPVEPVLYHIQWLIGSIEDYEGIGLKIGGYMCAAWGAETILDSASISLLRFVGKNSMRVQGYWWSPDSYGTTELSKLPSSTRSSTQPFVGEYSVLKSVAGEGETYTKYGEVKIQYMSNTKHFRLTWSMHGEGTVMGSGVLSDGGLCVTWRESRNMQKNDGLVVYSFEGDKAFGLWTLSGLHSVQQEDIIRGSSLSAQ